MKVWVLQHYYNEVIVSVTKKQSDAYKIANADFNQKLIAKKLDKNNWFLWDKLSNDDETCREPLYTIKRFDLI